MTEAASKWWVDVSTNGSIAQKLHEIANDSKGGAGASERLTKNLYRFCDDPYGYGRFLRGSMDGRKRYLVPESAGKGFFDCLVIVVDVDIYAGTVTPLRIYEPDKPHDAEDIIKYETSVAEHDYDI
jgi:hypothetical protein